VPSDLRINHVENAGGLEGEYVLIENRGPHDQDMTGWYLTDADDHTYLFPVGFVLEDGDLVTVWTREGDDTETDLYWGRSSGVWGSSDVATLWDSARNEISVYEW
jgi:competence protein ComEC